MESQYAPMAVSSSEKEESLLISISIFCLYKEQKHSFKRLAGSHSFNIWCLEFLACAFSPVRFGSFSVVNSLRDCAKRAF